MKNQRTILIPVLALTTLLCAGLFFSPRFASHRLWVALIAFGASLITLLVLLCVLNGEEKRLRLQMDSIFKENAGIAGRVVKEVAVACALIEGDGVIVWRNDQFAKLYDGRNIRDVMPSYSALNPLAAFAFDYAGGSYQVMSMPLQRKSSDHALTFQYWLNRTEAAHYQRLHEEQMPYVALIYIDNYEELASDMQFHRTSSLSEVEKLVADFASQVQGIYRRYESGRFLLVFEAMQLERLEKERFPLLEAAHRIDTGTGAFISLSISVGVADRIVLSDESARQAMELALGRGGDQAVVKVGANYRFYGGRTQLDSMQSRVKTRLFAKALRQLLENAGDVFIMGHSHGDMDCIGSALGVLTCCKHIGSRAFIVLDSSNATIDQAVEQIRTNPAYAGVLVTPEQAQRMLRPSSVLVVVDTQRPQTTCAPELIPLASRIVLVDHHRRSADYIDSSTLHYLESRASSASELITEVIQYFDDALRPPSFVCGALLAGITVDTKHFAFNVGSRTFEAAAYLRKNGADISMVKQLFQDDMVSYNDVADTVRAAEIIDPGIAVSVCAEDIKNAKLIAAKAADDLIGIRGIEAAFVLGQEDGAVSLSGRSLGKVNAQLICEKLGGGGHLTMAGAQFGQKDLYEAERATKACILEYIKEADLK